jgi:hypothetical protein
MMKSLLIHGCYDSKTLETLKTSGTKDFAFDLRGRSPNLIPFRDLSQLLKQLSGERIFLTFENDRLETVNSYLSLLKNESFTFTLIFRDYQDISFYHGLSAPFFWMYHPQGDWQSLLMLPKLKGILLPVKWQSHYQDLPGFWELIDRRNIEVFLHAESFAETAVLNLGEEINLSLDLTPEVEIGFRHVDQEKLKKMKIWGRLNENFAGQ